MPDPGGGQPKDLPVASRARRGRSEGTGKKTAAAIRQEITREVDQRLRVVFQDRRRTAQLDLQATEMAMRSALFRAGAAALS